MRKKIYKLLFVLLAFTTAGVKAQVVDSVITLPDGGLTSDAIVYVKVHLNDTDQLINAGITLSQNEIVAWADYSAFIRFNNKSNAVSNNNIIDIRNGGTFALNEDTVHFIFGEDYHCWFDIHFTEQTYDAYIQAPDSEEPVKIFEAAAFRFANPSALNYLSSIYNAGESPAVIKILEYKLTDTIGIKTETPVSIKTNKAPYKIYPNPARNYLKIDHAEKVSKIAIYDISGKAVLTTTRIKNNTITITNLKQGLYVVNIELSNSRTFKQVLIKE